METFENKKESFEKIMREIDLELSDLRKFSAAAPLVKRLISGLYRTENPEQILREFPHISQEDIMFERRKRARKNMVCRDLFTLFEILEEDCSGREKTLIGEYILANDIVRGRAKPV